MPLFPLPPSSYIPETAALFSHTSPATYPHWQTKQVYQHHLFLVDLRYVGINQARSTGRASISMALLSLFSEWWKIQVKKNILDTTDVLTSPTPMIILDPTSGMIFRQSSIPCQDFYQRFSMFLQTCLTPKAQINQDIHFAIRELRRDLQGPLIGLHIR